MKVQFDAKVWMKFGAAAVALASIAGCGSGSAKPFSGTSTTSSGSSASSSTATSGSGASGSTTTSTPPATTPSAQPSGGPQPTSVLTGLQAQSGWQTCGGCGNVGAVGQGPDSHLTQGISNPSLSGNATDFFLNGGPAFAGGYYFIEQPTVANPVSYLRYDFDLFVPGKYVNAPQAIEFEVQQTTNGDTYNFAWQADYASNTWRVFNYTTKQWEPSGIQLQRFTPDTWHHITAVYHAAGTQAVHDSLTVDGQTYNVNIAHEATQTGTRLEFTAGFQLDLNATSTPYHVFVDNMQVALTD